MNLFIENIMQETQEDAANSATKGRLPSNLRFADDIDPMGGGGAETELNELKYDSDIEFRHKLLWHCNKHLNELPIKLCGSQDKKKSGTARRSQSTQAFGYSHPC